MMVYDIDGRKGISSSVLFFKQEGGKARYFFEYGDEKRRKFQMLNVAFSSIFIVIFLYFWLVVGLHPKSLMQFSTFFLLWQFLQFLTPKKHFKANPQNAKIIGAAPVLYMMEWTLLYFSVFLMMFHTFTFVQMLDVLAAKFVMVFLIMFAFLPYYEALYFVFVRKK